MAAAFDLGMMLSSAPTANTVQQIPCSDLVPYHNHMFTLYDGERLEDMVESIRTNGVLIPIVVQPSEGSKYEILIGHNRWNASKIAGKQTVPAIVKQGLTPEEAEMYVIESNLMQRGFNNLKISEQAAVVAMRHKAMFSQGKRNDIIRELRLLENPQADIEEKKTTSDKVGEEYGMSRNSVARLLRIDTLNPAIKTWVDAGLSVRAGVELSYIDEDGQSLLVQYMQERASDTDKVNKVLTEKAAKTLREAFVSGLIDECDDITTILEKPVRKPPKCLKLDFAIADKYFTNGESAEEISDTIDKALEAYFAQE